MTAKILEAIRAGNYRDVAAGWAGIGERTLASWRARGEREPQGPYGQFLQALIEAEREAEIRMVALNAKAAHEDAKHAQWWLERKFPERWGRRFALNVPGQGGDGQPVEITLKIGSELREEEPEP